MAAEPITLAPPGLSCSCCWSAAEGTVRTHLENIYERLGVSSRTAAVTRAFPDRVA